MIPRKLLKLLHVTGTLWLALCAAFLLVVSLRQAGVGWWVLFSLSGFSGAALFLLLSIYLFAIFRGVTRKQLSREHPLTTSPVYIFFYDLCPLLGAVGGLVSIWTMSSMSTLEKIGITTEGTLAMTFLIWILGDPLINAVEGAFPTSAAHRRERLALERESKKKREEEKHRLLEQIQNSSRTIQERWNRVLLPLADELTGNLAENSSNGEEIRQKAIEFGARAWQLGGTACMQQFLQIVDKQLQLKKQSTYAPLAFWWDGIGQWRKPALKEAYSTVQTARF